MLGSEIVVSSNSARNARLELSGPGHHTLRREDIVCLLDYAQLAPKIFRQCESSR